MVDGLLNYICCSLCKRKRLHNNLKHLTNGKYMYFPEVNEGFFSLPEVERYDRHLLPEDVQLIEDIKDAVYRDEMYNKSCCGECQQQWCYCCCGRDFWDLELPKLTLVSKREIRFCRNDQDKIGAPFLIEFDLHGPPRSDRVAPTENDKLQLDLRNKFQVLLAFGEITNTALLTDEELTQAVEVVEKLKKTNIWGKKNSFMCGLCWPCVIPCCCFHYNNVYFTELRELEKTLPEGFTLHGKCK